MATSKSISSKANSSGKAQVSINSNASDGLETQPSVEELLQMLSDLVPNHASELEQLKVWKQGLEQLFQLQRCSRVLMAVVEPDTLALRYANAAFCQVVGFDSKILGTEPTLPSDRPEKPIRDGVLTGLNIGLMDLFPQWETVSLEQLYRQHLLYWVLRQRYQFDLESLQLLERCALASLKKSNGDIRYIKFWLNSELLQIKPLDPKFDEFADLKLKLMPLSEREAWLLQPGQWESLAQKLQLKQYRIEGLLLVEGLDITPEEQLRRLSQLLLSREALLHPKSSKKIEEILRSLFRADQCIFIRTQENEAQLFSGLDTQKNHPTVYGMESLADSYCVQALQQNQVLNVPDLRRECQTECDRQLRRMNVRSLLLIPLVVKSSRKTANQQILGAIGLTSDRPNHFNLSDVERATELIPALMTAICHSLQQRFTNIRNIHPSVEWRFLQEAERRSWGLPPETIVFEDVYPLYGISDIRSSSDERNRAIQADLLEQFRLGLQIIDTFCNCENSALGNQIRQDLLSHIKELEEKVTVEIEVQATDYLKTQLESYFNYFCQCDEAVKLAVQAYQTACNNEHKSVYTERSRYDKMLNLITIKLQETWNAWQERMQQIVPHYCDAACSDGIDHMIYVGKSIDSRFTPFHLHSLRYEQLRAICDCARTALRLKAESQISLDLAHLVLVQDTTIDIFHDEHTERIFDVRGTRDIRYEIVKKRIDKGIDKETKERITVPGMLTVVYSTDEEWEEYEQYLRYLAREGWIDSKFELGTVDPLPGVSGLNYARVCILPA